MIIVIKNLVTFKIIDNTKMKANILNLIFILQQLRVIVSCVFYQYTFRVSFNELFQHMNIICHLFH